jgi:phenylpropionate dioxygenase-like ring-hydroxylating dioxygenase large terminal subunit
VNAPESPSRRSNLDATLLGRTAPLPIASYFDAGWFERELQHLFGPGPNYAGSEQMVPEIGDYMTLASTEHGKVLVHGPNGVNLLSNTCRHRQGLLLDGKGNNANIVCPLHRWTYDLNGKLLVQQTSMSLPTVRCRGRRSRWNGLLFAGPRAIQTSICETFRLHPIMTMAAASSKRRSSKSVHSTGRRFSKSISSCTTSSDAPRLQKWVDAGNYEWGFGDRWSYQILGIKDGLQSQVSPNYQRYRDAILAYSGGALPKYGTVWSILYPNVMLEWYPCALVVSTLIPRSPDHTTNIVEFYYPEEVHAFERQIVEAHQAAYAESAAEDAEICGRLHRGRRALWLAGEDDEGPYHTPHEDGMIHLHDWIRRHMKQRRTP